MIDLVAKIDKALAITRAATPRPWKVLKEGHDQYLANVSHTTRDVWIVPHRDEDFPAICLWRAIAEQALAAVQHAIVFRNAMEAQEMRLRLPSSMIEGNPGSYREILRQLDDGFRALNQALENAGMG